MRSQHGLTLVELLIAMSITAAILVGLAGVVQVGTEVAEHWTAPVQDATVANQLADWLHQDSHRYHVCESPQGAPELHFCQPNDRVPRVPMVLYGLESSTQTSCSAWTDHPCDLVRRDCSMTGIPCSIGASSTTGTRAVLVRGLTVEPSFTLDPCDSVDVTTGTITVYNLPSHDIRVSFRAPKGGCP